ncbi:MAG: MFS transporter [Deltaproteobacteria bacterium]|nr:MFS transporter [Deltaproteobacteria bacterium]MBW2051169.1 MFS transporter [Deltaproteobacteria bacterium]MBW2140005.1 MFS transporter [Deltaproteobacteria bacterium]MBW2322327.1 MFS transporter [Deltaproteobacteria bacterium]
MKNNQAATFWRYRWIIFLILALAYLIVYFHRLSLSVVANDLVKTFEATASAMGLLGSIYFYCYALMQIPAGLLSDSIGPRKTVTFSLLVASLGSVIFGLAPNLGIAFLGRVMVGLGVSMVFIPTMKILSQWFLKGEFALMTGILNAIGGIGVLAATWLLAWMTGLMGWRVSFELIGACTFGVVVLTWLAVRDRPEDKGWLPVKALEAQSAETAPQQISLREGLKRVIREKYFWPLGLWFFFDCGVFFGFGGLWGGPYLMHVYGMTRSEAGAILSMIAWGMIVGSPLLGLLSDKILKSRKKTIIICNGLLLADLLFLNIFPNDLPRAALYAVFFVFSVASSAIVIIGFTTTKELFPVEIAGTSVGMVNFFPFLGGAVFMPGLGRVIDTFPKSAQGVYSMEAYTALLLILLAASVVSLIMAFLMKETLSKKTA